MTMSGVEHIHRYSMRLWLPGWRFIMILALATSGCQKESEEKISLPQRDIKTVMETHVDELMAIPGVTAVAIGELEDKTPCIKVYVINEADSKIPSNIEGHPVVVTVSGEITPMSGESQ